MSACNLYPTCDTPIHVTLTPNRATQAFVTASRPVDVLVTDSPIIKPHNLTDDGNFVLLPIAGGGFSKVAYDPVS